MVSVVIPCYNAEAFIKETIFSILKQKEPLEIIVIDDGSTDSSASIIWSISDSRLSYFYQKNGGVSLARNNGLKYARGECVIFFDSDDIMSDEFLSARQRILESDKKIGFCCGPVISFPGEKKKTIGVAEEVAWALLTYQPQYSSCPSNYLIRKSILLENHILFHEGLSSTADRFFLLQLDKYTKGKLINEGPLHYRISSSSMSGQLTRKLLLDNEKYFHELKIQKLVPSDIRSDFNFLICYILGLGFLKKGPIWKGMFYAASAIVQDPLRFVKKRMNRL